VIKRSGNKLTSKPFRFSQSMYWAFLLVDCNVSVLTTRAMACRPAGQDDDEEAAIMV
jgi:hypothetical protein